MGGLLSFLSSLREVDLETILKENRESQREKSDEEIDDHVYVKIEKVLSLISLSNADDEAHKNASRKLE